MSAAAFVISLQALLSSLIASVYGQGLALRGPLGSMVKTIDGMVYEQHQVVFCFVLAIACFLLQMGTMFMIMMNSTIGPICFGVIVVGGAVTYSYALRIYNRFNFAKDFATWDDEVDPAYKLFEELDPDADPHGEVKAASDAGSRTSSHNSREQGHSIHREKRPKRSFLSSLFPFQSRGRAENSSLRAAEHVDRHYNDFDNASEAPYLQMADLPVAPDTSTKTVYGSGPMGNMKLSNVMQEGYLALKSFSDVSLDPWARRYFLLRGKNLFYYTSKAAFAQHPELPINSRPIDLEGYMLLAGAVEPPYAISLIPANPSEDIRRVWKFRCDTLAEFHSWIDRFSIALKLCNSGHGGSNHSLNELVKLTSAPSAYK